MGADPQRGSSEGMRGNSAHKTWIEENKKKIEAKSGALKQVPFFFSRFSNFILFLSFSLFLLFLFSFLLFFSGYQRVSKALVVVMDAWVRIYIVYPGNGCERLDDGSLLVRFSGPKEISGVFQTTSVNLRNIEVGTWSISIPKHHRIETNITFTHHHLPPRFKHNFPGIFLFLFFRCFKFSAHGTIA